MKRYYSIWGLGYSDDKITDMELNFGKAYSLKSALEKFNNR